MPEDQGAGSSLNDIVGDGLQLVDLQHPLDLVEHRRRAEEDTEEPDALRWRLNNFPVFQQAAWLRRAFTDIDVSSLTQEQTVAAIRAVAFPPDPEAV